MDRLHQLFAQALLWFERFELVQALIKIALALTPGDIAMALWHYGLPALGVLFYGRASVTIVLRTLGLSHPNHYRYWPRLPWRGIYRIWMRFSEWREIVFKHSKVATGGFAGALSTFCEMYTPNKLFLGRAWAWGMGLLQPIGMEVTRHCFCLAMTGGGKTTWLISALQCWKGSAWLIDPKGQISAALKRNDWRTWIVFNPYDPENTAFFNVFDVIKEAVEREGAGAEVKWATRVSEALITTPAGSKNPYFTDCAREFVKSLILHILSFHDPEERTVGYMRELIVHGYRVVDDDGNLDTTPEESRQLLFKLMRDNPAFDGAVAGGAAAFAEASGETTGNLQSTLLEQTKWLDLPNVKYMLSQSSCSLSDAKTRNDVVFAIVAPVLSIREELKSLMRLLTSMTIYTFESVPEKKGQCLFIVDELQAQGYNASIEVALPVFRSYGVTFLGISQDLEGMKAAYPQTHMSFVGNADVVMFLGSNHPSNLDYLSKALGHKTFVTKDRRTRQKSYRDVPVLNAEQIGRLLRPESGNTIVLRAGRRALRLRNDPYFKCLPVTQYDADPDHGDSFWRSITRFFLNPLPKATLPALSQKNAPQKLPVSRCDTATDVECLLDAETPSDSEAGQALSGFEEDR